jgi:hypothetical protein
MRLNPIPRISRLALLALATATTAASASSVCVDVEAQVMLSPDPTCAIATDPHARAYLSEALETLTGPCFSYQFPATLTYRAPGGATRSIEATISGHSGQIAATAPIPSQLTVLALGDDGQPNGQVGVWAQAVSSLRVHDRRGRLIGRFVSRDQGLQFFTMDQSMDAVIEPPIPVGASETLVMKGTLALPGDVPTTRQLRRLTPRWSGIIGMVGDVLGSVDPSGGALSGRLCAEHRIRQAQSAP